MADMPQIVLIAAITSYRKWLPLYFRPAANMHDTYIISAITMLIIRIGQGVRRLTRE